LHVGGAEGVGSAIAAEEDGPLGFGAELEMWEDEGIVHVDVVVVDGVEGRELGGGETGGWVGGWGAEEAVVVEVTDGGVGYDSVGDAVDGIALPEHFRADGGKERDGDVAR
jgi:hypothetical protein